MTYPISSDINDEAAVLGCAVLDGKCAASVLTRLCEDDFTDADTAEAFRELRGAWQKYGRLDAVIISRLPHAALLTQCMELTPSLSGCGVYIEHVREKAMQQRAAVIGLEIATGRLSADELASRAVDIAKLADGQTQAKTHDMPELLVDFLRGHEMGKKPRYIITGLGLDGDVRLRQGDFMVIGARPSVGKTAYSIQLALNLARGGKKVLYFSLETNRRSITERMVACAARLPFGDLQDNKLDWRDVHSAEALDRLSRLPISVNDTVTTAGMMEALAVAGGYDAVIVDYLGLMDAGRRKASLYERVTELSMALHRMAQKNGLLVVALCQLNREGVGRPSLEHLRESGQIEQDADVVILLHSDAQTKAYTAIVAKNKTGRCGAIPLYYDRETQHFTVIDQKREAPCA